MFIAVAMVLAPVRYVPSRVAKNVQHPAALAMDAHALWMPCVCCDPAAAKPFRLSDRVIPMGRASFSG
jgi:hypothetical protein